MASIGITFNCEIRNNGTATYCHRALKLLEQQGLCTAKHYQPRGDVNGHDWYLYIDDGRDDLEWIPPHPNAYWAVDTHLGYGYRLWKARQFDRVYVAQKDAVYMFEQDGIKQVSWLPLACHPEAHPSLEDFCARDYPDELLRTTWDIAFVGFLNDTNELGYNNRIDYLDRLFKAFPNSWLTTNVFFEEMALRYVKARLGFNVSIRRDLNMRVFEVMSTGTPLLTNRDVEGIDDLFKEEEHYIGYEGLDEMVESAGYALEMEPEKLLAVGRKAKELVRAHHTYEDRMKTIMEDMQHV